MFKWRVCLFSFVSILLTIYFNRTKLSLEKAKLPANSQRNLRARERESRVPPSPRSSPVRRRSDHPLVTASASLCQRAISCVGQTVQRSRLASLLLNGFICYGNFQCLPVPKLSQPTHQCFFSVFSLYLLSVYHLFAIVLVCTPAG